MFYANEGYYNYSLLQQSYSLWSNFPKLLIVIVINIDRTFTLTHFAPTCGEIRMKKKLKKKTHCERGRSVSQDKGPINVYLENDLKFWEIIPQ